MGDGWELEEMNPSCAVPDDVMMCACTDGRLTSSFENLCCGDIAATS